MSAPSDRPPPSQPPAAPDAPRALRDASAPPARAPDDASSESPEEGARTAAEYTEPPGSHRRPSDGAALDVGG